MKICILTGKFGMGHMSAAFAIKQQIENQTFVADIEIYDWFEYISPRFGKAFYKLFSIFVTKGQKLYNVRYRFYENKNTNQKPELNRLFYLYCKRFMKNNKPDLIISTLPVCSQIVSWYKEKTGSTIPLITCVTDITGHSEWICNNTNLYLVGAQTVKQKLAAKGVLPSSIIETGIPVRREFINWTSNNNEELPTKTKLLFMGGGLGILPDKIEFYQELDHLPNLEVTIITGHNEKLYHTLYGKFNNLHIIGFIPDVWNYMVHSDVIVSKPGGVTTFEAIHTEVPIIALNPGLQQELYNAQFIKDMNIGDVVMGDSNQCLIQISNILRSGLLQYYKFNIRKIKDQLCTYDFVQIIDKAYNDTSLLDSNILKIQNKLREECNINEKVSINI